MKNWFKKRRAEWNRFWHCFFHMHRMVDAGESIRVFNLFSVWKKKEYIGCECGKKWYSTSTGEWLVKKMNEMSEAIKTKS